LTTFRRL